VARGVDPGQQIMHAALVGRPRGLEHPCGFIKGVFVIQHASQFEADLDRSRRQRERLSQRAQALGRAAVPEEKCAIRQIRPPGCARQFDRLAKGFFRRVELCQGILRQSKVLVYARLLRACPQGLFERSDGLLEAVGVVEGAAGKVPGIYVAPVHSRRCLEEALCTVPFSARGADPARQDVPLRVAIVESDGALRLVQRGLKLVQV
jgi:hypothetical protein